ncbi:MAG: PDZ domain-containing protein [Verrucomicrobiales bacterium]|nr:PDZ domain-containing protein [Verrucomicrobiales bacterium]
MNRFLLTTFAGAALAAPAVLFAADAPPEQKPPAEKPKFERRKEVGPPEEPAAGEQEAGPESDRDRYGKYVPAVMNLYKPVVADSRLSTVTVFSRSWSRQIAMGAVVHENGFLITKASELEKSPNIDVAFAKSVQFPGGLRLAAKVVDTYKPFDLALLKVEATGLRPVKWATENPPSPGSFLAAPGLAETPVAYGVASVETRNLDDANKGFLGIALAEEASRLVISTVKEGSAAMEAGLKLKDELIQVNGKPMHNVEEFIRTISGHKPLDKVKLRIKRGDEEKEIEAILRRRGDFPELLRRMEDPRNKISGALSSQRSGFPNALQHDLFLRPIDCGGPLVDLDGHVIGLNIARSGRIQSLAIPSTVMAELLRDVGTTGKFYHPELDELKKNLETLKGEQQLLKEREARMEKEIESVRKKIESILGPETKPAAQPAPEKKEEPQTADPKKESAKTESEKKAPEKKS